MKIIQIGCNDGNDHVFSFCKNNTKDIERIVLIDADSNSLEICRKRYTESFPKTNLKFINCAITPIDCDSIKLFTPKDDKLSGFTSFNKQHVIAHLHNNEINEFSLSAKSLTQLLLEEDAYNLDWLFIDTEGLDALNLFSVNFSYFNIKNIIFEYIHTDGIVKTGPRLDALCFYLKCFGYDFKQNQEEIDSYNLLAYKK